MKVGYTEFGKPARGGARWSSLPMRPWSTVSRPLRCLCLSSSATRGERNGPAAEQAPMVQRTRYGRRSDKGQKGCSQSACYGHATDGLSANYPGRISTVTAIFPAGFSRSCAAFSDLSSPTFFSSKDEFAVTASSCCAPTPISIRLRPCSATSSCGRWLRASVEAEDKGRGYEYSKGAFLPVEDDELDAPLPARRQRKKGSRPRTDHNPTGRGGSQ
jgi:hypothetical protein